MESADENLSGAPGDNEIGDNEESDHKSGILDSKESDG